MNEAERQKQMEISLSEIARMVEFFIETESGKTSENGIGPVPVPFFHSYRTHQKVTSPAGTCPPFLVWP